MKKINKFIERAFWFFPVIHLSLILSSLYKLFHDFNAGNFFKLLFLIYLFPPILYRLISLIIPIKKGVQKLGPKYEACGWMIAHRIQMIYAMIPFFEQVLISIPGLYSNWLRLWGSKIGHFVYFAPNVNLQDRTDLNIGSETFVGGAVISNHLVVSDGKGGFALRYKPVKIGSNVFISAQCNIGPGSIIKDGEFLKILTQTLGGQRKELI